MSERIEITWYVEDGYVGRDRPQHLRVDLSDFEFCDTEKEVEQILEELLEEAFNQRASWGCPKIDEVVTEIFAKVKEERNKLTEDEVSE